MPKFQTDLAEGLFDGTQIDLVPSTSHTPLQDVRFLLENEEEILVAYGDELTVVEVEDQDV